MFVCVFFVSFQHSGNYLMKSISGNKIKKIVNGIKKTANEKNEITTYLACKRRQTNGLGNLRDAIERKKDFLMTVTVIENKV